MSDTIARAIAKKNSNEIGNLSQNKADKTELTTKADKAYVDTELAKKREASVKLGQTDMTEEFLQQMAGTTPINAVPADYAVTVPKTNFLDSTKTNLFNKSDLVADKILDYGNGNLNTQAEYSTTNNFIEVKPSTSYILNLPIENRLFYDANKAVISGSGNWTQVTTLTTPADAKYIKFSIPTSKIGTLMFMEGTELPSQYVSFGKYVDVNFKNVEFSPTAFDFLVAKKVANNVVSVPNTTFLKETTRNLFNKNTASVGKALLLADGSVVDSADYTTSDYIPIRPSTTYKAKGMSSKVFYDENKNYVSGEGYIADFTTTTPSNVYFVRIVYNKTEATLENQMFVEGAALPSTYIPYSDVPIVSLNNIKFADDVFYSKLKDKKWNALGDSITANPDGYHKKIADKTGCMVRNYGITSSTIANYGNWENNPMVLRYTEMDNDADIVTVFGGVNDAGDMVPMGTIDSTDITTFYGACNVLFSGLITKYPTKLVAILTPLRTNDSPTRRTKEMAQAVKEVATKYSLPCLDLYNCSGITTENISSLTSDLLHPTDLGHAFIAGKILSFLESNMPI